MLFILVEFIAPQETIVICELQLKSPLKRSKGDPLPSVVQQSQVIRRTYVLQSLSYVP